MEFLAIFLVGALIGWGVPATKIHSECQNGKQEFCQVEKKINLSAN